MRAGFDFEYYKVTAACHPDAIAKLVNGLMQAGRQGPMLARLQIKALAALSDCAQTIFIHDKWLLTAGIARAQHLAGDDASCKKTLAPIAVDGFLIMSEEEIREDTRPRDAESARDLQSELLRIAALCP
jgi:hypothetical protein